MSGESDSQLRTEVQYGGETSSYGNEATTGTEIGKVKSFTPINNNNIIYTRGLGDGRNYTNALWGNYDCGGNITWEVHDFAFLKHWIGPLTGAGTTGDPYILTENDNVGFVEATSIQTFSLEVNHQQGITPTDDTDTYIGCVGNNFTLNGSIGTILTCNADFVAQKVVSSTTGTAYTPVTTNPWLMAQGTVKWASSPSTVAGIQDFSLTYSNSLIITRDATSRFITMPVAGPRIYNFTLLVKMNATIASTIRDDFYGQANEPIDATGDANPTADLEFEVLFTEGSASSDQQAELWLDQCTIDSIGKPVAVGEEVVLMSVNGTAQTGRSNIPIKWWAKT